MERLDAVVVGAGIGGLTAGLLLRRGGRSVAVLERGGQPGGRGRTQEREGFSWNLGPHALFAAGEGVRVLASLGIRPKGSVPRTGGMLLREGALHPLPGGLGELLSTTYTDGVGKLAIVGGLVRTALGALPPPERSLADWLAGLDPEAAALIGTLARVATYGEAPAQMSARATILQVRRALRGVLYLDGGWQQLVDALAAGLESEGAPVRVRADAVGLDREGEGWRVTLSSGEALHARDVVLAAPPASLSRLGVELPPLVPARAACLDLGLAEKPPGAPDLVLGVDRPLYLSNHSATARLSARGVVVHLMRYLRPEEGTVDAEPELEALMDQSWPGWRERVLARRYQPALTVSHGVPLAGRPRPAPALGDGRWLVGDWVGEDHMLADACFASASHVARAILAR